MSINREAIRTPGPCSISFGGVDLGLTNGDVEVQVKKTKSDIRVKGALNLIDKVTTEIEVRIKAVLGEATLENLVLALGEGAEIVTDATDPTKKKVIYRPTPGQSLYDLAQALIVHPKWKETDDLSRDIKAPKAVVDSDLELVYKADVQAYELAVEFLAFDDDSGDSVIFGDPSAAAA